MYLNRKLLYRDGFVRNVLTMLAGNASAQIISFLAAPFIARLYDPGDFGTMALLASYISIFSVIVSLRYENAIVLAKEKNESMNVFTLTLLVECIFFLVLLFLVVGFRRKIAYLTIDSKIAIFLWFLPFAVFFNGLKQSLNLFFTKKKNFGLLSSAQIIVSATTVSVKITAGLIIGASSAFWLIMGNILGPLVALIMLSYIFLRKYIYEIKKCVSTKQLYRVAKKFKNFPKFSAISGLLNEISQNFPVILLAYYFPKEIVGFYGFSISILKRPISLVAQSLNNVFLQRAAEEDAQGTNLKSTLKKTTLCLAAIGVIPFGILAITGSQIFVVVFGENWETAGTYVQLMAPWLFFLFINPPSTQVIQVKQRLAFQLYFTVVSIICRSIAIVLGAIFSSDSRFTIGLLSTIGVLLNIYYISYSFYLTNEE